MLVLFSLSHVAFVALLVWLFDVPIFQPMFASQYWWVAVLGIGVGVGVMSVALQCCHIAIMVLRALGIGPTTTQGWVLLGQAGWLTKHLYSLKVLPWLVSLPLIVCQVGSEEIVFRLVAMDVFQKLGVWLAVSLSTGLFVIVQLFSMPTFLSALYSVIGATVMGICHGILYYKLPLILPLIVSHVTFFLLAVL